MSTRMSWPDMGFGRLIDTKSDGSSDGDGVGDNVDLNDKRT